MESKITIFSVIDVIDALSGKTLRNGNLSMMDNSPFQSTGQGTPELCTLCQPGQEIYWHTVPIDVQTPVAVRSITFLDPDKEKEEDELAIVPGSVESDNLHLNVWSGIVPYGLTPGVQYRYRFEVQMYEGKNSILSVTTPSLKCI